MSFQEGRSFKGLKDILVKEGEIQEISRFVGMRDVPKKQPSYKISHQKRDKEEVKD